MIGHNGRLKYFSVTSEMLCIMRYLRILEADHKKAGKVFRWDIVGMSSSTELETLRKIKG